MSGDERVEEASPELALHHADLACRSADVAVLIESFPEMVQRLVAGLRTGVDEHAVRGEGQLEAEQRRTEQCSADLHDVGIELRSESLERPAVRVELLGAVTMRTRQSTV